MKEIDTQKLTEEEIVSIAKRQRNKPHTTTITTATVKTEFIPTGETLHRRHSISVSDLQKYPKWKQYLYWIPYTTQTLDVLLSVGEALKKCAWATCANWIMWTEWHASYNPDENKKRRSDFLNFTTQGKGYNHYYLKQFAKKANPQFLLIIQV